MDEDFKDVTKSSKLTGIILLIAIVTLALGGYFFVFKQLHFSVKNIKLELGDELSTDVKDYLTTVKDSVANYELDTSKVQPDTVGTYTYTVKNGKSIKKGKIEVVDTTPPEFTVQKLTIEEGNEDYFLGDFLETCEDLSRPCLVTLKNSKDESKFSNVGVYSIEIEVADVYGNKKTAKVELEVVAKGQYVDPKTTDLEYASNSKGTATFDGKIFKKLKKAINSQLDESADEMSAISTIDLEAYVAQNHPGYRLVSSEIIELYNKSLYVIGYAIELKITNGKEMTVYVDSEKVPAQEPEEDSTTNEE